MKLNKRIHKVLVIAAWSFAIAGLLVVWGFAESAMDNAPCTNIDVAINNIDEHEFIGVDDVFNMLKEKDSHIKGEAMSKIDVAALERMFNSNSHIENAEVFKTINGELKVKITTKRPIARIINYKGESFYLDENGWLMSWSDKYTPDMPVFSGNIYEQYQTSYRTNYAAPDINDSVLIKNNLYGIYRLAKYFDSSEFWKAQIQQVYVGNDVELVPLAGNHIIVFGTFTDIDEKLNKLMVFYEKGLNNVGWNLYDKINLKYKNQVVCTKIKQANR